MFSNRNSFKPLSLKPSFTKEYRPSFAYFLHNEWVLCFFFLPDLIPKENLEKWLNYLNNELPTIAFKSAMQPKDRNKVRIPPEVLKVKQKMAKALLEMKGLGWGPKAGVFFSGE